MRDTLRCLDTLPSDVLILIFDYCHAFDLVRLNEVCTRFYDIIHEEILWIKKSKQLIATNQTSPKFRERTGTCVYSWPDPTDTTLYCISSDYQYTMITGTKFNCRAVFSDHRQRSYLYFMNLGRMSNLVILLVLIVLIYMKQRISI